MDQKRESKLTATYLSHYLINSNLEFKVFNCLVYMHIDASRICVSSSCRDHANLLCIVAVLEYVLPKQAPCLYFQGKAYAAYVLHARI